jgi:hypothetical protein
MATLFTEADAAATVRYAELLQDEAEMRRGDPWKLEVRRSRSDSSVVTVLVSCAISTAHLKAIQDLEDRFGLSPKARQLARVTIDQQPPEHKQEGHVASVRRLRAVDAVAGA